jgi:hypothetical protein
MNVSSALNMAIVVSAINTYATVVDVVTTVSVAMMVA